MKEHQKFFSVKNLKTGRIEAFVTVANTQPADHGATILKGNQKEVYNQVRLFESRYGDEFADLPAELVTPLRKLLASDKPGMAIWREHLFSWMMRNAESAMDFFKLPTNRVVELGSQVEI